VGDQLRQGGVYLRVFSSDMRAHTVLSPLSGTVVEINEKIAGEPLSICEHPSESCWLIRLKPSKFDLEIKELGLQEEN
jgi:glycine cleavage system H lipoate-binding protein